MSDSFDNYVKEYDCLYNDSTRDLVLVKGVLERLCNYGFLDKECKSVNLSPSTVFVVKESIGKIKDLVIVLNRLSDVVDCRIEEEDLMEKIDEDRKKLGH